MPPKSKTHSKWTCQQCGYVSAKAYGKCPDCGTWDSMVETMETKAEARGTSLASLAPRSAPQKISDVVTEGFQRIQVPMPELARVLGGGIVPGSLVLIGGEPGIGKCLVGSTRILDPISGAFLPITEWAESHRPVLSLDETTYHLSPQKTKAFLDQGIQSIVQVKTRLGRTLRCTPSHPVLTPDGWRAVGDLVPGARIASPRALPYFGKAKMPEHQIKMIAYALADGSAGSQITVTNAIPEIANDLAEIARKFQMQLRVYPKPHTVAKQFRFVQPTGVRENARRDIAGALKRVHAQSGLTWADWSRRADVSYAILNIWRRGEVAPSATELERLAVAANVPVAELKPASRDRAEMRTSVARFLESVGLRFVRARAKFVPACVFGLPRAQLALFLRVLFSCDGSVYVNQYKTPGVSYSTISERLAQDVQHLLLRFGFVTRLRTKTSRVNERAYTAYEIQLLGVSEIKRFLEEIGIAGRAQAQARIAAMPIPTLPSTHFDTIPTGKKFWAHLQQLAAGASLKQISSMAGVTLHYHRENRPLARSTVAALANAYPSPLFKTMAQGEIYWDAIESITHGGTERVYDLSVPTNANFIANDLVVHNSTLLLQMAATLAQDKGNVLYVSGEESVQQMKMRAERLALKPEALYLLTETNLAEIIAHIERLHPKLVVVDSIQTIYLDELASAAGSISQVRESAARLMATAKETNVAIFLVGHVTKAGAIAGPRVLEHIVDAVLYLEGERFHSYRLLRSVKNRFGATSEVGVFEMTQEGMREVDNPSSAFLAERAPDSAGNAIAVTMEGTRPLLVEIQALTSSTAFAFPRRTANGFELSRLLLLTAVLSQRCGLKLFNQDVFVNVVGGLKINEPAADLTVALAIASSFRDRPVAEDLVVIGEVGLSGELRTVSQAARRLTEAARLGFKRAIVPQTLANLKEKPDGIALVGARTLAQAMDMALVKSH
ncbi:MAG: DNA repair protein RadA [Chloroflexi bacterium]|nr:DNA repair protein RadA [Chloroflexota bacterium]